MSTENQPPNPVTGGGSETKVDSSDTIDEQPNVKKRIPWNKGRTKLNDSRVAENASNSSKTKKANIAAGKYHAWNKGLTKEQDERLANNVDKAHETLRKRYEAGELSAWNKGQISEFDSWNKGLTKEQDERVAQNAEGTSRTRLELSKKGELPIWNRGLTAETDERVRKHVTAAHETMSRRIKEGILSPSCYARAGYREDLGHGVRSSWEANFARLLLFLGHTYGFEEYVFELPQHTTYCPDFFIYELNKHVEVKGHWREGNQEKLQLFRDTYPDLVIDVVDEDMYRRIQDKFSKFISNWER